MRIISYLLASSMLVFGTSATAQTERENSNKTEERTGKTTSEKVDKRVALLTEKLDLTIDQQSKTKEITRTLIDALQEVKSDSAKSEEEKKNDIKLLRKAYQNELNSILSEEQQSKMSDLTKKKTTEERSAEKTAKMAEKLSLTPEQIKQVDDLNLKVANKIQAIKQNKTSAPEKKREFIQGNMNDYKTIMKTILTPEQWTKYENWMDKKETKRTNK